MAFAPTPGVTAMPGMSAAGAGAAGTGGFLSSIGSGLSNAWGKMKENPEMMAIMMDMIGSKLLPEGAFAGVGTTLAKSKLASEAEKERKLEAKGSFDQLINAITGKTDAGPSSVTLAKDPTTGNLQYNITGLEEQQQRLKEISEPIVKGSEDFLRDFGGS